MKKIFGQKSKIFLIIFLSSILFINFSKSQTELCEPIAQGSLESPKFCFNKSVNITKFVWKGTTEEQGGVEFTLKGFETSTSDTPKSSINFVVDPGVIYTGENSEYLLSGIQCLKYKVELYKCDEDSIPRVDQIFIYYSF